MSKNENPIPAEQEQTPQSQTVVAVAEFDENEAAAAVAKFNEAVESGVSTSRIDSKYGGSGVADIDPAHVLLVMGSAVTNPINGATEANAWVVYKNTATGQYGRIPAGAFTRSIRSTAVVDENGVITAINRITPVTPKSVLESAGVSGTLASTRLSGVSQRNFGNALKGTAIRVPATRIVQNAAASTAKVGGSEGVYDTVVCAIVLA